MATRSVFRSFIVVLTSLVVLVLIALLLQQTPAQAHPQHRATTIDCIGSIQACIDAASDGDTIVIPAGTYTESLTLSKPVSLTGVNRDTTILHAVAGQRVLTVTGATISNSVVISGLTFTGGNITGGSECPTNCGSGILVTGTARPLLQNITLFNNRSDTGGSLFAEVGSPVTLTHVTVISNSGGGVLMADRAVLHNTDIISNQGGAGHILTGIISGGQIQGNHGGLGNLTVDYALVVTQAYFIDNASDEVGGGVFATNGPVSITHSVFEGNYADCSGGGVYAQGVDVYIEDSDFIGNRADGNWCILPPLDQTGGGGLYANRATIVGGRFVSNTAHALFAGGGGVRAVEFLTATDTLFFDNHADVEGGGVYAGTAIISGGRFDGNSSSYGGGLQSGSAAIDGTTFAGNSASWDGGGIVVDQGFLTGTQFISNTARNGGALSSYYSIHAVNSLFADNTAINTAAALHLAYMGNSEIIQTSISSQDAISIPAVVVAHGTAAFTDTIITNHSVAISNTDGVVTEDYNLFFGNITNTLGVITDGGHSLVGDPKFVDPLNGDYHLRFGSAAIDHGVDAGVYTDLDGKPRPIGAGFDIGAYEFSGGPRYVATTGNDTGNDCLNEANPCATVQHAIDVAQANDQVFIASGLYTESATLDKPVSLLGANRDTTIIHAVAGQRVLTVTGATISNSVVISGLAFTGGYVFNGWQCPENCGGGILLINNAQPMIQRVIISDNVGVYGGGLYSDNAFSVIQGKFVGNEGILSGGGAFSADAASVSDTLFDNNRCGTKGCLGGGLAVGVATSITGQTVITNSIFTNNMADNGSAVFSFRSTTITEGRFTGNVCGSLLCGAGALVVAGSLSDGLTLNVSGVQFIGNSASNDGSGIAGAIYFTGIGAGRISNSLFAQNQTAEQGAAIFLNWGSDTTILNSTFADVDSNPHSAIAVYAGSMLHVTDTIIASHTIAISNTGGTVHEDYNLFFNNITNTLGVTSGGHSLIGDPRFVDPLNGDYHLRFGSAAIDHGVDAGVYTDLDGNPRPKGAGFDIGAYEYQNIRYLWLPLIRKSN